MFKRLILLALCLVCFCFSGCAVLNSTDLLMLPEISPEQTGLLQLVNAVTANSVWTVTAPAKGDELSSMQFVDFFGDGVEEAVCFFKNAGEMTLRVTVYSNTGPQGYTELCSFETEGYGVDSAKYADLDGDGDLELILFVGYESSYIYGAEVYKINNRNTQKVSLGFCSAYALWDMTLDGNPDIVLARHSEHSTKSLSDEPADSAELFSWIGGNATRLGTVEIVAGDPGTAVVSCGMLNPTMSGCVFDVAVTKDNETRWISNVLTWDGKFINLSEKIFSSPLNTARGMKIPCRDANFDGGIEMPLCIPMPFPGENSASADSAMYTVWYGFNNEYSLIQKSVTYCFPGGNWYYIMPESWYRTVYVKTGSMDGLATFAFAADKNGRPNTLLTVYRVTPGYSPALPEDCFFVAEAGGYSYYALAGIPDELDPLEKEMYLLTEEEILESFVTVDALGNTERALTKSTDVIAVD